MNFLLSESQFVEGTAPVPWAVYDDAWLLQAIQRSPDTPLFIGIIVAGSGAS
jgi:hypothetical protein